jgi:hypothetical protein
VIVSVGITRADCEFSGATQGKKAAEYELWAQTIAALAVDRRGARDLALAADKTLKEQRRYRALLGG